LTTIVVGKKAPKNRVSALAKKASVVIAPLKTPQSASAIGN